jgi:hypothetical protein
VPGGALEPKPLPWARPRHERLLLLLVALAALTVVYAATAQDVARLCLARAVVAGRLNADACLSHNHDQSKYGGHLYSDKAPGMSAIEVIPVEIVRLPAPQRWRHKGDLRLWAVRLLVSGVAFLASVFMVGRIAEGLAPGWGAPSLVTFALCTQMGALAATGFSHVLAGTLGFAAFVVAARRRAGAAGLLAGFALFCEYDVAAIVGLVGVYVLLQGGRQLCRYVLGVLPGILLLGAYGWAAFGAPWHNPLRYTNNDDAAEEASGVLGIHLPTLHGTGQVFLGDRGLLLVSPVCVVAAVGLVLVWRTGRRAEALVCAATVAVFVIAECGYFLPYGGASPGPRFLVPSLPFLAVGLGPAFRRLPIVTTVLAAISLVASTAVILSWVGGRHYRDTLWGEILRVVPERGSARLMYSLPANVLTWGANRLVGAAVVSGLAVVALAVALSSTPRRAWRA